MDTKGREGAYVRDLLCACGVRALLADAGCLENASVPADISRQEIFAAAGANCDDLAARGDRVGIRSRWASGAAPVMVRVLPDGVIEAGADPYGYRVAHAY